MYILWEDIEQDLERREALGSGYPKVSLCRNEMAAITFEPLEASFGRAQSLILENDWFMGMVNSLRYWQAEKTRRMNRKI